MISEKIERFIETQPPGTIGPRLVKLLGIASVGASLITKSSNPTKTFMIGVAAGTIGNSLNSLVGHRQAAHGAIKLKPGLTNESLRLATGVLGGIRMRAVPMHRWHHENADTPLDPDAPGILGRGRVFRSITKISEQFALTHPEYTREVGSESVYTSPRFYENTPLFIGAVVAGHVLVGKKLGLPVYAGSVSAGIHLSLIYAQNAMFTADVHSDDRDNTDNAVEIRKFPYGNTMNVIFGSENGHQAHHDEPGNPRLSDFDAVYTAALALRKLGWQRCPT